MLTGVGYSTIRPSKEHCMTDWGDTVLNAKNEGGKGFQDYCNFSSCTYERLEAISKYNNYAKEWKAETALFEESTSLATKRFIAFKLYAKFHKKHSYHLDKMEGGHCKVGNVQANFCSPLEPERG